MRGLSLRLELREPQKRLPSIVAAHLRLRLQSRTARGTLGLSENSATQIVAKLHATHACRLADRHAWM